MSSSFPSKLQREHSQILKATFSVSKGHDFNIRKSMPDLRFMRSGRQMLLINRYEVS